MEGERMMAANREGQHGDTYLSLLKGSLFAETNEEGIPLCDICREPLGEYGSGHGTLWKCRDHGLRPIKTVRVRG